MGKAPVLDDTQMHRLREVVGGRKSFNLCSTPSGATRRLPEATETVLPSGGGYSSYFKLSLGNNSGGYVVTIADGATGSNNIAVVNGGTTYSIPPFSGAVIQNTLYFLKYTPIQYDSGGQIVSGATMVISSLSGTTMPTLPSGGTGGAYYMQLGRCLWSNGSPRIVQDFTAGVAEFNWYVICNQYAP